MYRTIDQKIEYKRQQARERQRRYRQKLSEEKKELLKAINREARRRKRAFAKPEEMELLEKFEVQLQQLSRFDESEDKARHQKGLDRVEKGGRRTRETKEETGMHKANVRCRSRSKCNSSRSVDYEYLPEFNNRISQEPFSHFLSGI